MLKEQIEEFAKDYLYTKSYRCPDSGTVHIDEYRFKHISEKIAEHALNLIQRETDKRIEEAVKYINSGINSAEMHLLKTEMSDFGRGFQKGITFSLKDIKNTLTGKE